MTQEALVGLEEQSIWKYFGEISAIPRESGNEAGVRSYLIDFAKHHGLAYIVDATGNVIIRKPATAGNETKPSVALQGHMDMVCVKDEGVEHDFAVDPIRLVRDGDILSADGTTLGADNGIALAIILSILADSEAVHGPLEGIFTVEEETGLTGAFGIEEQHIESRLLLNLDSDEEGVFYIGCAGGVETVATFALDWQQPAKGSIAFSLSADGMRGGHSGAEIHTQRANAIKAVARPLAHLDSLSLYSATGGTRRNVIPSTATIGFTVLAKDAEAVKEAVRAAQEELSGEYAYSDPEITLHLKEKPLPQAVLSEELSGAIIRALHGALHGVDAMSMSLEDVVETSTNLALLEMDTEHLVVTASHRSSILSARDDVATRFAHIFSLVKAEIFHGGGYPSWEPNPDSAITKFCAQAYQELTKKEPKITAIHAGLECGIINSKVPGMDSVSFGPNMWDIHSTKERLSISSAERVEAFTRHLLSIIE